jgi:hypothetical protein
VEVEEVGIVNPFPFARPLEDDGPAPADEVPTSGTESNETENAESWSDSGSLILLRCVFECDPKVRIGGRKIEVDACGFPVLWLSILGFFRALECSTSELRDMRSLDKVELVGLLSLKVDTTYRLRKRVRYWPPTRALT